MARPYEIRHPIHVAISLPRLGGGTEGVGRPRESPPRPYAMLAMANFIRRKPSTNWSSGCRKVMRR